MFSTVYIFLLEFPLICVLTWDSFISIYFLNFASWCFFSSHCLSPEIMFFQLPFFKGICTVKPLGILGEVFGENYIFPMTYFSNEKSIDITI